jgi:hypothetical protein
VEQRQSKLASPRSKIEKDPISLEPLDCNSDRVFEFRLSESNCVSYNIVSLVNIATNAYLSHRISFPQCINITLVFPRTLYNTSY